jgi:hypothetical protein
MRKRLRYKIQFYGKRVVFSLFPALILIVTGELIARNFWQDAYNNDLYLDLLLRPDFDRIWALNPGHYTPHGKTQVINEAGLRESHLLGLDLSIMTLGDSSIFGHGLNDDETLHFHLKEELHKKNIEVDVICGAVPGYSTMQSILLLDDIGWQYSPDLLVVGNLWSDNNFDVFVDRDWIAELNSPLRRADRVLKWSRLWQVIRGIQPSSPDLESASVPISWIREPMPQTMGVRRVNLTDYYNNLQKIADKASDRDIGVIFLAPSNKYRLEFGDDMDAVWIPYFNAMQEVAKQRGIPIIDGLSILNSAHLTVDEAFIDEMHPTSKSNELYSKAISEELIKNGWPENRLVPNKNNDYAVNVYDPYSKQ